MNQQLALNKINQAMQHLQQGKAAMARDSLSRVLKAFPDSPEVHFLLGLALVQLVQPKGALAHFNSAIALAPDLAEAYVNRGILLKNQQQLTKALQDLDRAIALRPGMAEAYSNRGNVRVLLDQPEQAGADFAMAIRLDPHNADALVNMAALLASSGDYMQALPLLERAVAINPQLTEAQINLANVEYRLGKEQQAMQRLNAVLQSQPSNVRALGAKSHLLAEVGDVAGARALLDKALSHAPADALARYDRSLLLLLQGDYAHGWQDYEARKLDKQLSQRAGLQRFSQPEWQGEDLSGKTLLLHQEQGLGDAIQMLRYLPQLRAQGARVLILLNAALVPLASQLLPSGQVFTQGEALPHFDLHCPVMSLPLRMATTLDKIPAAQGYLAVDEACQQHWAGLLGEKKRLRVGLAWSGSAKHLNDRKRSLTLAALSGLLQQAVEWHSLQREYREDADERAASGIIDHAAQLLTMQDTAGLISQQDLVISVDTSVAHLAAALGKPCWLLLPFNPDFRWGLGRSDSPWYTSMRLFRQPQPGDWASVLDEVAGLLAQQVAD
ncbi:tetratricopeptide repeat protein [Aquitalea pelogenes]|uniref:tetratricopeptide repeat-containing glycosyltransferase family protein n=1 Tax=Aquitalea pelogenes TaxID=1293573 RepID=UPI00078916C3|nr:tetratricopeptide repeat protein [Aquitalea pelogenes]